MTSEYLLNTILRLFYHKNMWTNIPRIIEHDNLKKDRPNETIKKWAIK